MNMEFWGALAGAAVGVVAGTIVQFLVQKILNFRADLMAKAALRKEMECNLQLVAELEAEAQHFRNAVNGDVLATYFGYFNFERGLFIQASALLNSGLLYKLYKIDDLKKLQIVSTRLQVNTANFINQNITRRREAAKLGHDYNKQEAVQFVNFVDTQIKETRKLLSEFIAVL
jgi:hypothetical protein